MLNSNNLYSNILSYDNTANEDKIRQAFEFAKTSHKGQFRATGEDYITHPLAVAEILIKMKLDSATIMTALLHDVVEDSQVTLKDIKKLFGNEISKLVDGVTKLKKIELKFGLAHAENFRKLLVSSSDDIRVLLVKLADRLHNIRTINGIKDKNKRLRIFYIAPFLGMFILILNALGIPNNNFDPSKGDTLKVHYYSFLITISFIFIFARTINNKRLVSFISLTLLTSCFVFIMGFPKIESSNINFYLNDKNTFSNLCQVGKVIVGSDKNCNQPVSICDHNLYAESISFETISEKKVRTISENYILKMEDGNNNIISVNNPYDCVKNLENGILLYNPIGRDLKIPPLINILYFFISLFSGIFLKRIKTI